MAANLIKPEHFAQPQTKSALIPPSAFEQPPIPCKADLQLAYGEIKQLKLENEKLRSLPIHGAQGQRHVASLPIMTQQTDYADELIKRQAGEIAELKSELVKCRKLHEQDTSRLEKDFKALQNSSEQELISIERQARMREEELEQNIDRLSRELQRTLEESESHSFTMKERYESTENVLNLQIKELQAELNSVKRDADKQIKELEEENRQKSACIQDNASIITQLKNYIGQTDESLHKPAQLWKMEKETVDNQLKMKQAENDKLCSQMDLLEVRFKALNDIQAIQEGELSKVKGEVKQKQRNVLLTRWREKVYALLVQQQSSEIVNRNDLNKSKQQIQILEETVESYAADQEVLKHSLTEKMAQLQIEIQDKQRLEKELAQTQEIAVCLDDQTKDQEQSVKSLADFAQSIESKYQATLQALEEKAVLLKALCQRVSFASSRMDVLKTQLLRKTLMSTPVELEEDSKKSVSRSRSRSMSRSRADEDVSRDSEEHLYQELERVMRERDSLATQVRTDSSKWSQKMTETRSIYQTEIITLKKTVDDLESNNQQKSKTCAQLTEELTTLKEETQEYQDTIAQLQQELARHARGVEGVLTDQRMKDDEMYSDKISDLQRQLNESKREHAKTVVSLRQLERTHPREIERRKDLLGSTEEHLNSQVQQLHSRLVTMEKEKNTMKATLRQEGLLSKLKSDRKEPVWLPLDSYPMEEADIVSARGPLEPVENVLQDLKSLSAAIFSESLSEDEEEKDDNDSDDSNRSHDEN